jgi:hypothetical protein
MILAGWPASGIGVAEGAVMVPTPGTSTVALARRVKRRACNWLFGLQPAARAVIVVCNWPAVGVTPTPTTGVGIAVGVGDGVTVDVAVGVLVGVRVTVAVEVCVGVAVAVGVLVIVGVLVTVGVFVIVGVAVSVGSPPLGGVYSSRVLVPVLPKFRSPPAA